MNIVLWVVQALLAVLYLMAGGMKTFNTAKARETMTWTQGRSDSFVRFVGTMELLGAAGLVLPLLTGILPWLTVLAAIGLALIQLLAISTVHLPRKEYSVIPVNIVLLALVVLVAIVRWTFIS
ncbi:MAG: DoxX family protein [Chloroflexota bacterium]